MSDKAKAIEKVIILMLGGIFTYGSILGMGFVLGDWKISILMLFFIMGHNMDRH